MKISKKCLLSQQFKPQSCKRDRPLVSGKIYFGTQKGAADCVRGVAVDEG